MAITSGNNTIRITSSNRTYVFDKEDSTVDLIDGLVVLSQQNNSGEIIKENKWSLASANADGYSTVELLLEYLADQLDATGSGGGVAQVNTDFLATSGVAELLNKPTTLSGYGITDAYPLSGNPSAFITASALTPYLTITDANTTYQPLLVSGTNLKTINGSSLLDSGNITISGGSDDEDFFMISSFKTLYNY